MKLRLRIVVTLIRAARYLVEPATRRPFDTQVSRLIDALVIAEEITTTLVKTRVGTA